MRLGLWECDVQFGPSVEDTYLQSGYGVNTGVQLTEAQLNELTERYAEDLYSEWYQYHVERAEAACEGLDR